MERIQAKSVVFSKAIRRQIASVDLVYTLAESVEKYNKLSRNEKGCIARIKARVENLKQLHYGNDKLYLSKSHMRKYQTIIKNLGNIVSNVDVNCLANDFYNAILMIVHEARMESKKAKNKQIYKEWGFIDQSLMTLYKHIDPELDQVDGMEKGKEIGEKLLTALADA